MDQLSKDVEVKVEQMTLQLCSMFSYNEYIQFMFEVVSFCVLRK